jgi:hypothetical protein
MIETKILHYSDFPFLRVYKGETIAPRYRARSLVPIKSRNRPVPALLVTALTNRTFVTTHRISCNQNRTYYEYCMFIYNQFTELGYYTNAKAGFERIFGILKNIIVFNIGESALLLV